eukprot:3590750-Amphidinium_carterae.2
MAERYAPSLLLPKLQVKLGCLFGTLLLPAAPRQCASTAVDSMFFGCRCNTNAMMQPILLVTRLGRCLHDSHCSWLVAPMHCQGGKGQD